jgi:hypothetical protein
MQVVLNMRNEDRIKRIIDDGKFTPLEVEMLTRIVALETKMNFIAAISSMTFGVVIYVLVTLFLH